MRTQKLKVRSECGRIVSSRGLALPKQDSSTVFAVFVALGGGKTQPMASLQITNVPIGFAQLLTRNFRLPSVSKYDSLASS
jgi:hypothetical protein